MNQETSPPLTVKRNNWQRVQPCRLAQGGSSTISEPRAGVSDLRIKPESEVFMLHYYVEPGTYRLMSMVLAIEDLEAQGKFEDEDEEPP